VSEWWERLDGLLPDEGAPPGASLLPVVGFRAFHLGKSVGVAGHALISYSHSYVWEVGKNVSIPCSQCVGTFEYVTEYTKETRRVIEADGYEDHDEEIVTEVKRLVKGVWPNRFHGCRCGFWAAHTIEELMVQSYGQKDRQCIIGAIIGWGRVQVGELLLRAQYARILCLTDQIPIKPVVNRGRTISWLKADHEPGLVEPIAEHYGVPIVPLNNLKLSLIHI